MNHNEIIERARDRVLARAFSRMAQMAQMAQNHKKDASAHEGFILILCEEVLSAFMDGVNAKADAMMATQSEVSD